MTRNLNTAFTEKVIATLENFRLKHGELCELSQRINQIYAFPILTITLEVFLTIVLTIFYSFSELDAVDRDRNPPLYAAYSSWVVVVNCLEMLTLVFASEQVLKEVKNTSEVVHLFAGRSKEVDDYVTHFSLQLLHNGFDFSGCKIFSLDGGLLFSIVGAVSTYLVIVIQFQAIGSKS